MLDISIESRKGILFVRFDGSLNEQTLSKIEHDVSDLLRDNGISNVVFNMENVKSIDIFGVKALLNNYELCINNKGKSLICNIDDLELKSNLKSSNLLNYLIETKNELTAFSFFNSNI